MSIRSAASVTIEAARPEDEPAIGSTREFAALCPASSACLTRAVRP